LSRIKSTHVEHVMTDRWSNGQVVQANRKKNRQMEKQTNGHVVQANRKKNRQMEIRTDEKEDNMKDRQKEIDGWAYRQKGNIPTYSKTKIETGR